MAEIPRTPGNLLETEINSLDPHLKQTTLIASWLPEGMIKFAKLTSTGKAGFSQDELRAVEEKLSKRRTAAGEDPPLFLRFNRSTNGAEIGMGLMRFSQTLKQWEQLLYVDGSLADSKARVEATEALDEALSITAPIFSKINNHSRELAQGFTDQEQNSVLMRSYFSTHSANVTWLGLESPFVHITEQMEPLYRLYLNPQLNHPSEFGPIAKSLVGISRKYTNSPLSFKLLFTGSGLESELADNNSTKFVYYFTDKAQASEFAKWLGSRDELKLLTPSHNYSAFAAQDIFNNGLLLLGKGTKEDRAEINHEITQGNLTPDIIDKAGQLSIPI